MVTLSFCKIHQYTNPPLYTAATFIRDLLCNPQFFLLLFFTIKLVHLFFIYSEYSILFQNGPKWSKIVCDKYLCLYLILRKPVQIFVFVFVFALFCQPKYISIFNRSFFQNESICIFIHLFLSTLTYFLFIFVKKMVNQIIFFPKPIYILSLV